MNEFLQRKQKSIRVFELLLCVHQRCYTFHFLDFFAPLQGRQTSNRTVSNSDTTSTAMDWMYGNIIIVT